MKKAYPGHAKRVMMAVWSYLRQFMYTKWVIVVDDDIDARDWKDVMWAVSTRMDPARDITRRSRTRRSTISTSPRPNPAWARRSASTPPTSCRPRRNREWGRKIRMDEDVVRTVTEKWARLGPARFRQA